MRFLLINVPVREDAVPENFPTGLGILASVLRNEGYDVDVLDVNAHRYSPEQVRVELQKYRPDVIGVSGMVSNYRYLCAVAALIKEVHPHAYLISGGGCATSVPQYLLSHAPYDALVIGEGERTLIEFAEAYRAKRSLESVPGLAIRAADHIHYTDLRFPERDLDAFPLPAYDLFPTEIYLKYPNWKFSGKTMNTVASRGCPMDCHFCYNLFGKRSYRMRGVDSIVKEIRLLRDTYGVEGIAFVDNNLTASRRFLLSVCDALKKENIRWGCHGRVDASDDERLSKMAEAGCVWLGFGIESGSERILRAMNKKTTRQRAVEAIENTRKHNIFANTTFIYGYPGETRESIIETMRFQLETGTLIQGFFATPYPGTELFRKALESGAIEDVHEFLLSLNNAYDFILNLTDIPDDKFMTWRSRSFQEVKLAHFLKTFTPDAGSEKRLLHAATKVLEEDCLLPELKSLALEAVAKYYTAKGEHTLAMKTRGLALRMDPPSTY